VIRADVCVLGAGPAGSTIALRLAQLGHSVVVLERAPFPRPHIGESLAPDILSLLDALGIREMVEAQGFLRPDEAIIDWGDGPTVKPASGEPGFQVDRRVFDSLLLAQSASAGAVVLQPFETAEIVRMSSGAWRVHGRRESIEATYLVDATGRRGRLGGRKQRVSAPTLALYAYWRDVPIEGPETRVEAGESQWYWGAPLPDGSFNATVFVEPSSDRMAGEALYDCLLERSRLLRACRRGRRITPVACCDATCYFDERPIGGNVVKVGEASFSLDPLSSQGVRSAMGSALHGALAIHTLINRPESDNAVIEFMRTRQQEAVGQHKSWAGALYSEAARRFDTPFWNRRRATHDTVLGNRRTERVAGPVNPEMFVHLSPEAYIIDMPCVDGDFIVPAQAVEHPGLARPVAYLGGVYVPPLLDPLRQPQCARDIVHIWARQMPVDRAIRILSELHRLGLIVPGEYDPR
jgi:flavin-dependent dehydrogenase